jgi:site-specific DNA recombinase
MSTHSLAESAIDKIFSKRAFDYLRVSSDGQVRTDYDPDGLSINAQREAGEDRARELDAEIVREFLDPGKSAYVDLHKRTDFLEMLEELKRCNANPATFIDYVIVWSLSRFARNQRDYWMSRELVRQAGARLVSVSEPMIGDDSAAAFFTESIIAAKNQYESMQTSENVKRSLYQKAKGGGTYGWTRLGYANTVDQLPDGRRVSIVAPDPDRHPYMTAAFKLYASAEYSVSQLADELYRLGLRSRPRKNRPAQKVNAASVHRILRDPYYAGWIVYKRGTPDEEVFEGRHEALIDQETFDHVQMLLDEKRVAKERPQKRSHFLRGSVHCHECGNRLTYAVSTGENGRKYAYFFCSSRINRTSCTERANYRPELVEAAAERMYLEKPIRITSAQVARSKAAIRAMVEVSQESLTLVREAKTELIQKLKAQQQRLIRLYAEEGEDTSPDAFRAERARMRDEIKEAEKSLSETEMRMQINAADLCRALELAEDVAAVYKAADATMKRGYNQAFCKRIKIRARWDHEMGQTIVEVAGVELTEPYALLLAEETTEEALAWVAAIKAGQRPENAEKRPQEPDGRLPGALSNDDISIFVKMAEGERFELSVRQ